MIVGLQSLFDAGGFLERHARTVQKIIGAIEATVVDFNWLKYFAHIQGVGGYMRANIFEWLREDPFGPEIFGLGVEIILIVIIAPFITWLLRRAGIRKRVAEMAATLIAKLDAVKSAAHDFADTLDRAIRNSEFLTSKYGVTREDLEILLKRDYEGTDEPTDYLQEKEAEAIRAVVQGLRDASGNFNENAAELITYLEDRHIKHNVHEARDLVTTLRDEIRNVNSYSRRSSLLEKYDSDIAPAINRVLELELRVGPKRSPKFKEMRDRKWILFG